MTQLTPSAPPPPQAPQFSYQTSSPQDNLALALAYLQRRIRAGANNFYWIAALSVINSVISAAGSSLTFVIGLSITQIVDGMAAGLAESIPDIALVAKVAGVIVSIVISGIFVLFGFLGGRGRKWAFLTGMVLYAIDGIILLFVQDWIGFAFHLFFLWSLWTGLQALNKFQKLAKPQTPLGSTSDFPKDIGVS